MEKEEKRQEFEISKEDNRQDFEMKKDQKDKEFQMKMEDKKESFEFANHVINLKALNNEDTYSIEVLYINGNHIGGWQGDGISEYLTEGVWVAYVKDNEITDIRTYFVF
mgnify:CR=1 FL=1